MTQVLLVRGEDGAFKSCTAKGHASFAAKGHDIVCSAETLLLRTAVQVLKVTDGIMLECDAGRRGFLAFSVKSGDIKLQTVERLKCTAEFIKEGISSLQSEYPKCIVLKEIIE